METDEKYANYFFIGKDEVQDLGKESFAHFTARTRFRKIFSEHCSGDYEKDFLGKTVNDALKPKESDDPNSYSLLDDNGVKQFLNIVNEKIQRHSEYPKEQVTRESTLRSLNLKSCSIMPCLPRKNTFPITMISSRRRRKTVWKIVEKNLLKI